MSLKLKGVLNLADGQCEPVLTQRQVGPAIRRPPTPNWFDGARQRVAALALSAVVASSACNLPAAVLPSAAHAVTNEQLLYLEAWRAVDRAYVDKSFNGNNWFKVWQHLGERPLPLLTA
jgi:hypothetical protein